MAGFGGHTGGLCLWEELKAICLRPCWDHAVLSAIGLGGHFLFLGKVFQRLNKVTEL